MPEPAPTPPSTPSGGGGGGGEGGGEGGTAAAAVSALVGRRCSPNLSTLVHTCASVCVCRTEAAPSSTSIPSTLVHTCPHLQVRLRLPDGGSAQRRFSAGDPLSRVFDFVDSLDSTTYLRQVQPPHSSAPLPACGTILPPSLHRLPAGISLSAAIPALSLTAPRNLTGARHCTRLAWCPRCVKGGGAGAPGPWYVRGEGMAGRQKGVQYCVA